MYHKLYQSMVKHSCLINLLVLVNASYYLTMHGRTADEFSLMLLFFPNCFYSFQKLKIVLFHENLRHLLVIYIAQ